MDQATLEMLPEYSYTYKRAVSEEEKQYKIKWTKCRYFSEPLLLVRVIRFQPS